MIALGLEQAVEAWHHHELGVEARENVRNEIRDNKQAIDGARPIVAKNKEDCQHSLEVVRLYLAHKPPKHGEMKIPVNGAALNSTSWTTASATGALGYIGYAEAKRFATSYEIQALLQSAQQDMLQSAVQAYSDVAFNEGGPSSLREDQLRELERKIVNCLGRVVTWDQLAGQLSKEYERALQSK